MEPFVFKKKTYEVDENHFLIDFSKWDKEFSIGMAPHLKIHGELTEKHWCIIGYIRETLEKTGTCPLVYQTCRSCGFTFNEMKKLFPTGYQRGACLLSGISFKDRVVNYYGERYILAKEMGASEKDLIDQEAKIYQIDVFGFLVDPSEWDKDFALNRAYEMGMPCLTDNHFKIINFLRDSYQRDKVVPTVYGCCESNHIDIEEFELLFPTGYHRGAVKIAGLRLR
jgi:tRNA 2-thiouridine synthesizing protein E